MLNKTNSYRALVEQFQWDIPPHYNIGVDVCDKWADSDPDRLALIHKHQDGAISRFTFRQLRECSNQVANLLLSHGFQQGDRVGILLPQAPETGYSHIAVYKLGGVAIPLFTLFGSEALAYRLANSQARFVITDRVGVEKLAGIRDQLPLLEVVFCIEPGVPDSVDFHQQRNLQSIQFQPVDTRCDDPALIIYTSGTTGNPKGALHAHRTLLGHLPGVEMSHNFLPEPDDRFWTPADWAWIGGLYDVLMPAWHHGIPVVSHRFAKFDPEAAFQLIEDLEIRNAFLPPTALKMMRTVEAPENRWRLNMRSIASGGETLGSELLEWGRRVFGLTINEFYGQTECNMIVSNCTPMMENRPGVMGRPVAGHRLAIIDATGQPLPVGELGEIAVQRPDPVMFLEYWGNAEATRNKFVGDWLLTGDSGVMDDEGNITFVGRDDDLITSSGYRIGPGEIENSLMGHPAVKMAGVVGVPDEQRTEIVKAYIVLNGGYVPGDELVREIQEYVKSSLAAYEYPRQIEFINDLPMTTTGKVVRRTLRQWHIDGEKR